MRKGSLAMIGLAAGLLAAVTPVHAMCPGPGGGHRMGGHPGMIHGLLLHGITLTPEQEQQVQTIRDNQRQQVRSLFEQLHTKQEALADKLLTAGDVDQAALTSDSDQIAALRTQLQAVEMHIAVAIRNVLTADQLSQAAARHAKMKELKSQMDAVLEEPN